MCLTVCVCMFVCVTIVFYVCVPAGSRSYPTCSMRRNI